jgi:hypothetical protein
MPTLYDLISKYGVVEDKEGGHYDGYCDNPDIPFDEGFNQCNQHWVELLKSLRINEEVLTSEIQNSIIKQSRNGIIINFEDIAATIANSTDILRREE